MIHVKLLLSLLAAAIFCLNVWGSENTDPCDVIWTTPSQGAAGSMPLGNGEIGINLWVQENGDLNFYISRTDSFSEISRLLKVGQVRVSLSPNPFVTGSPFKQQLHLQDGICEITAGKNGRQTSLKVFVDSDAPIIHVLGTSQSPISVKASVINWRDAKSVLPPEQKYSAWSMHDAPFPLEESADVFPEVSDAVVWYHRNETACVPSTVQIQSLQSIASRIHDPLLHRTFGAALYGKNFKKTSNRTIELTGPSSEFALTVTTESSQAESPAQWLANLDYKGNRGDALTRTTAWWRQFWDRSWVITNARSSITVPANNYPLRIGFDSNGQNRFPGSLARTAVYNRILSTDEIRKLAGTPRDQTSPIPSAKVPDFSSAFTLEAWINADKNEPGRIFDKIMAGSTDGFLLDIFPGSALRLIVGDQVLATASNLLSPGQWHHVAATIDPANNSLGIYLDGKVVAEYQPDSSGVSPITRAYTLQRYVQACQGRGNYPIKFNGGLFTVEPKAVGLPFNADFRSWGDCYWWQNTRHMYHPMLASGDIDMMDPLFKLYETVKPLCEARAELYHHCKGCYFPETMTIWGTYSNGDYGWNRDGHKSEDVLCPYWQFAWNQGHELVGLLLDRWDYTGDPEFLKHRVLPMATSVLDYFDSRFKKDSDGRIILNPTQAVETYWSGVINDMPSTAGLNAVTARLCALPANLVSTDEHAFFLRMKANCPRIPVEEKAYDGHAVRKLAPGAKYIDQRSNVENPELYAVWPFRLFGIGKPGLDEAIAAYDHRVNHQDVGWGYDGNCAALLGLTDEAARILNVKCANSRAGYRWPATWGPNFDWLPDQNHGGNLLETTQLMLLQCDGQTIRLLPAWPKNWDVSFKLHAPGNTVVECDYRRGKIKKLAVTPSDRRKDVVLPSYLAASSN
jgi:hypothetical protein